MQKEIDDLKSEHRKVVDENEQQFLNTIGTYKQEIAGLNQDKINLKKQIETMKNHYAVLGEKPDLEKLVKVQKEFEVMDKEFKQLKAAHEGLNNKNEALKDRIKELALRQDTKLREKTQEIEKLEATIGQINQLVKTAVERLKICDQLPNDSSFFEHAFKAICKSHHTLQIDLEKLISE